MKHSTGQVWLWKVSKADWGYKLAFLTENIKSVLKMALWPLGEGLS